jgi:hypothetical protein
MKTTYFFCSVIAAASARLKKSAFLKRALAIMSFKKIFSYIEYPGLVQQQDKIVVRFALTIYPYSLARS